MMLCKNLGNRSEQSMTDYIIIVALIAIAAIACFMYFKRTVHNQTVAMAGDLAGQGVSVEIARAQTTAGGAKTENAKYKSLKDYVAKAFETGK